jgi:hypothetical protein
MRRTSVEAGCERQAHVGTKARRSRSRRERISNGELPIRGRTGLAGALSRECIVAAFRYSKAYFRQPAVIDVS